MDMKKGFKHSDETKRKISLLTQGNKRCLGRVLSFETKEKISKSLSGRKLPEDVRKKIGLAGIGRIQSEQQKKNTSERQKGPKSHFWRGGVSSENKKLRASAQYKEWRKAVFERDDYTCVLCKKRGCELHPDHIKQFALFPELRFVVSNGRTLCAPCHRETPSYGKNFISYRKAHENRAQQQ